MVGEGSSLADQKRTISEPGHLQNCGILMHQFSDVAPTTFDKDCVLDMQKKSSKFRFLLIKSKPFKLLTPNFAIMYDLMLSCRACTHNS